MPYPNPIICQDKCPHEGQPRFALFDGSLTCFTVEEALSFARLRSISWGLSDDEYYDNELLLSKLPVNDYRTAD